MSIVFGYARVSTAGQSLEGQVDQLRAAGVDERHLRVETASGRRQDRPVLVALLEELADGDGMVVTKLDRVGRSMQHLVQVVDELDRRGVRLRSLSEQIDTSSAGGRFMVHMLTALAQMEADLIRERTMDGLAAARSRGRVGGRPTVIDPRADRRRASFLCRRPACRADRSSVRSVGVDRPSPRRRAITKRKHVNALGRLAAVRRGQGSQQIAGDLDQQRAAS